MVYILEGVDGSGKSTLFNKLKVMLPDAIFIKESYTPSAAEKFLRLDRFHDLTESDKIVIYDRATVCDDFVYCAVKKETPSVLHETGALGLLHKATIIYLDCGTATAVSRLEQRGDNYITINDVPAIKEQYEAFFAANGLKPFRLDVTSLSKDEVVESVKNIIVHKSFKMAQIVPVDCLPKTANKGYHMCLANIAIKNERYAEHFAALAASNDSWVLMDNGAAEGEQLSVDELLHCYDIVKPQEIVLPDTLLNGPDTIRKGSEALRMIYEHYDYNEPFTIMAVPQGATLEEWKECASQMVQWHAINAIGISKFLQMQIGKPYVRLEAARILGELFKKYNRPDIEVHLLGCSESPHIINTIRQTYPFVRGCDSAYAYICTQAGVCIDGGIARPSGEIDFINGSDYSGLEANMQALEYEVGAYNDKIDDSWR